MTKEFVYYSHKEDNIYVIELFAHKQTVVMYFEFLKDLNVDKKNIILSKNGYEEFCNRAFKISFLGEL